MTRKGSNQPRSPKRRTVGGIRDADRRLRQADRLARVFRVLQFIQGRGRYDARAIAQELEVSERTVYRDLSVLELAGIPWTFAKEERCYRLRNDYRFPPIQLTEDELLGQATAVKITEASGLDITAGAKPTAEKLAAAGDRVGKLLAEAQQVTEVLDLKLVDHARHREIIRTVQWALLQRKQLTGLYVSPYEAQALKLTLHPFRLALIKACWYVIGQPADTQEPKTFRVTRFKSLRMIDEPADVPKEFDLRAYLGNAWGVYRGEQTYDVELLFTREVADVVTETTWHSTQQVQHNKDGTVTLSFRVDGLNEIVRWALGWGQRVKVIRPSELRQLVIQQHQKAIAVNSGQ